MLGYRFLVAITKSHKPHESHTSKGQERIGTPIINPPGILPVSRSAYKRPGVFQDLLKGV